ncbi:hypothetical protein LPJ66_005662 [Kickxella alabastrina]|uniref:Uncharacterized protein n=1 Tax=Kickxella alabastrina TaxID=61397 RepID=A0ACC1IEH6_9FUNG|nr:hypothetical protein LPJ66_005662 [Kickxella alabastrina]
MNNSDGHARDSNGALLSPGTVNHAPALTSAADNKSNHFDSNQPAPLSASQIEDFAFMAMCAATALVEQRSTQPCSTTLAVAAAATGLAAQHPAERAVDFVWQLGLVHPESGLVPDDDYGRIHMLQFLYIWATRVLPALHTAPEALVRSCDLATLSSWISLQRRRQKKQRGPFWNGRLPSAAEVVVAPFANHLLHAGIIPDTQEHGALASWLAAVQALSLPMQLVRSGQ